MDDDIFDYGIEITPELAQGLLKYISALVDVSDSAQRLVAKLHPHLADLPTELLLATSELVMHGVRVSILYDQLQGTVDSELEKVIADIDIDAVINQIREDSGE